MNTDNKLNKLLLTKADIKQALIDKGLNPSDVFSTYADDIRSITSGESSYELECYSINANNYLNRLPDLKGTSPTYLIIDDNQLFNAYPIAVNWEINFENLRTLLYLFVNKFGMYPTDFLGEITINAPNTETVYYLFKLSGSNLKLSENQLTLTINSDKLYNLERAFVNSPRSLKKLIINTSEGIRNVNYMFLDSKFTTLDLSECNFSTILSITYVFYNCTNLKTLNIPWFEEYKPKTIDSLYYNCKSLEQAVLPDLSEVTSMKLAFYGCDKLLELGDLNTVKCNFSGGNPFSSSLLKINSIDFSTASSVSLGCFNIYYMLIKNFGKNFNKFSNTTVAYQNYKNWGKEIETIPLSIGARQSLIDSLITYSADRSSVSVTTTINLHTDVKALLTDSEIAQITAKGYTIA